MVIGAMKAVKTLLVLLVATLGMVAFADGNGNSGRPNRLIGRVLAVGDSITWGAGTQGGYRGYLEERLLAENYKFEFDGGVYQNSAGMRYGAHEGHGGWTIMDFVNGRPQEPGAGKLSEWLRAYQPQVVLFMAGTNDNPWETRTDRVVKYNRVLNTIYGYDRSIKVVLASIVKSNDVVTGRATSEAMNYSVVRDVVGCRKKAGYNIVFADTYTVFNPATDLSDTYHPNSNGYYKVANAFYNALTR
ncbi:MAG: hypothetical protein JSS66_04335 [Armatimonadetes bacterium]|nr:hypothetical protein [Armatimonadota bacterium]